MTDPVTPKAERRVTDGEVVESTVEVRPERTASESRSKSDANARRRAHNRAKKEAETPASANSKPAEKHPQNAIKNGNVLSKPWVNKSLLWGGFLIMVAAILFYTRPNMDWQVEHINRLQVQVTNLQASNQALADKLEQQQTELDTRISEIMSQPENKPLITQADLEAVKLATESQLSDLYEQVQTDLTAFNRQAETKLQALAEQATSNETPSETSSETDLTALNEFQQKVEGQLSQVDEVIRQLLTFKQQQEQQVLVTPELQPEPVAVQHLTSMQIQEWMIDANNQWLLKGNVEQTQSQLLALEQALAMTDVSNKTEIARVIGQDLSQIKAYSEQTQQVNQTMESSLAALNKLVKELPKPDMSRQKTDSMPLSELMSEGSQEKTEVSPLNLLLEKLSGLISVKKRESEAELSAVEGLLLHDALTQRLALLVDRVNWASSIESTVEVKKATAAVQTFIDLHFSAQSQAFEAVLTPLSEVTFSPRPALSMVSLDAL